MAKSYTGPVVFASGVHYPVDKEGHPDYDRPLRLNEDGNGYRDAEDGEPFHNDVNHAADLELDVGGE